jgi:hypothetical protein
MQLDKPQHRESRNKPDVDKFRLSRQFFTWICLGLAFLVAAQDAKAGGSPLDTILSTHLFADVPEAKDFVRESRPPPEALDYQPVTGPDREGPKLRNKDELKALQNELESAATQNEEIARKRLGFKKPAPVKPANPTKPDNGEESQTTNSARR